MISIVIPAHNEQDYLPTTLRVLRHAVRAIDLPHEIIVVDDASTDRTAAVAAHAGARVLSVNLRQISRARNAGAAIARGDHLVFIDADTWVTGHLLAAAARALRYEAIGGGARVRFDNPLNASSRTATGIWNTVSRLCRWAAGCFLFVRRDAFESVGGFNAELFAAEEIDLSIRLQRVGPFTILPQEVTTSARKMQSHPLATHLVVFGRTIVSHGRVLQQRDALDMWYRPCR